MTEDTRDADVAIDIPADTSTGCEEWMLAGWTLRTHRSQTRGLPLLCDHRGDIEPRVWTGTYALKYLGTNVWRFPDGERCTDKDLTAAFARRRAR